MANDEQPEFATSRLEVALVTPEFTPDADSLLEQLQGILTTKWFVQVKEPAALAHLREWLPGARELDVAHAIEQQGSARPVDLFGYLLGRNAEPKWEDWLTIQHTDGEFAEPLPPDYERHFYLQGYYDLQRQAFLSLDCPYLLVHSLPSGKSASDDLRWNDQQVHALTAIGLIAEDLLLGQGKARTRLIVVSGEDRLGDRLFSFRPQASKQYPVVETPLLYQVPSDPSSAPVLAAHLLCDGDTVLRDTLVRWLDEVVPDWQNRWVDVLRLLRVRMLPQKINGPGGDSDREVWQRGQTDAKQAFPDAAVERLAKAVRGVFPDTFKLPDGSDYDYVRGKDDLPTLVATALGVWVYGGVYAVPTSWLVVSAAANPSDAFRGYCSQYPPTPTRFRSLVHGWASELQAFSMWNPADPDDQMPLLEATVEERWSVRIWHRFGEFARTGRESQEAWAQYLEAAPERDRLHRLRLIGVDGRRAPVAAAAAFLSLLDPAPPPVWTLRPNRSPVISGLADLPLPAQLAQFVRVVIEALGQGGCAAFYAEHLPGAAGSPERCLVEWLLSQEWAERIARPLASYLGFLGCQRVAQGFGIETAGLGPVEALTRVCIRAGVPPLPQLSGPRSLLLQTATAASRLLERDEATDKELRDQVMSCAATAEMVLKQLLELYCTLFPRLAERVQQKIADRIGKELANASLQKRLDKLDLGYLTSCFGSLRKDGSEGGRRAAEVEKMLGRPVRCERVEGQLERVRVGRNFAAHGIATTPSQDQRQAFLDALRAFVQLWEEGELKELAPSLVLIKERRRNAWGQHAQVIDEFGSASEVHLVELSDEALGEVCYFIPRSNPKSVAPLLVRPPKD